jgi:branched-chain amino acid aminotransferase
MSKSARTVAEPASLVGGAAFVNDKIVPVSEAGMPLIDAGLSRSDLTYDVVGVWGGSFFQLDAHLDRFERGCKQLRLVPPKSRDEIAELISELVSLSQLREAFVEVICTRGFATSMGFAAHGSFQNQLYAYAVPYVWVLPWESRDIGMDCIVARSVERISPNAVDPTVKNFQWGDFTRGLWEAYDRDAHFVLLLDGDGNVTEGPGYNVFAAFDGKLVTPDAGVLQGISRLTVLRLAAEAGIETSAEPLPADALYRADEILRPRQPAASMA